MFLIKLTKKIHLRTWIALGVIAVLVPVVLFSLFKAEETQAEWYNEGWAYRKKITIDGSKVSGSTDFTDFPILIEESSDSELSANAQADGDDILFTDAHGVKLAHEIESYSSGTLVAWVKVNTIYADEDTLLYMYYGNPNAPDQSKPTEVWNSDYAGVWHMDETSSTRYDSTANNNDLTSNGTGGVGYSASGQIGNAADFELSDSDYLSIAHADQKGLGMDNDFLISFWANIESWGDYIGWMSKCGTTYDLFEFAQDWDTGNSQNTEYLVVYNSAEAEAYADWDNGELSTSNWYFYTLRYDSSNDQLFFCFNGTCDTADSFTQSNANQDGQFEIGRTGPNCSYTGTLYFDGLMDEVRVMTSYESNDFVATLHNSQNSPSGTFYVLDSEEVGPGPIAYWKFDEGADNTCSGGTNDVCDSTSSGNDGAITGATWQTEDLCFQGKCLFFHGASSGDQVAANRTMTNTDNFTLSAWIKPIQLDKAGGTIVYNGDDVGGYGVLLNDGSSTDGRIAILYGSVNWYNSGYTLPKANVWYHISLVRDNGTATVYVNGQPAPNTTTATPNSPNASFEIGNEPGLDREFPGFIDEVKIYPYARTADQVKADYNTGAAVLGTSTNTWLSDGLLGYWKMDESSGTSVVDSSGNGNTGTLTNAQETGTATSDANTTSTVLRDNGGGSLSSVDDVYNGMVLYITDDAGCGLSTNEQRLITDYNGTNKDITVGHAFSADLDACDYTIRHQAGGRYGNSVAFEDDGSGISVPGTDFDTLANEEFTIAAWIYPKSPPDTGGSTVIKLSGTWESSWQSSEYSIYVANNGISALVGDGTNSDTTSWANTITYNAWNFIACGINADRMRWCSINGVLSGTTESRDVLTYSNLDSYTAIGTNYGNIGDTSTDFYGKIDEVRIYDRTLTEKEVRDLYNWAPDPVGHWHLDENVSGDGDTFYDSSGYENNGTGSDGSNNSGLDCTIPGKFGSACKFDGADDSIQISNPSEDDFGYGGMSASAWIKSTASEFHNLVDNKTAHTNNAGFALETDANGYAQFLLGFGDAQHTLIGTNKLVTDGYWHHITGTLERGSGTTDYMKIYVDGILISSYSLTDSTKLNRNITSSQSLMFGSYSTTGSQYTLDGFLDEVKIYNYPLSPQQVVEDMNAGHPTGGSPIGSQVAYWKFDEMYGNTINNSASETFTTSVSGATWTSGCKVNDCLDYDGTDDVITITNEAAIDLNDNLASEFSISAWINADSDGEGDNGQIFQKGTNTYCRTDTQGSTDLDLECSLDLTTSDATLNIADALTTDTWHHIVLTYTDDSDDEITIWVDGVNKGSSTNGNGAPAAESSNLLIGGTTTANFDGSIDELKIYNSALTEDQIKLDYNAGLSTNFGVGADNTEADLLDDTAGNPPIGYWDFNENIGSTAYDKSGAGYDLTKADGKWTTGKYGSAYETINADGNRDRFYMGTDQDSLDFTNSQDYTLNAWVKITDEENTTSILINKGGTWVDNDGYNMSITSNDYYECYYTDGNGSGSDVATSTTTYDSNWHHVSCVMDRSGTATGTAGLHIFVDGILENSDTSLTEGDGGSSNADDLEIGEHNADYEFDASIDEVKIYNYARTPAQIAYDYNRGRPIGWWKFDECEGATAYDASGNGNNGTITSGGGTIGTCGGSAGEIWADGATGKRNASLNFNSSESEYVDIGNTGYTSIRTVAFWTKPDSTTEQLLQLSATDTVAVSSGTMSIGGFGTETVYVDGKQSTSFPDTIWHHVVVISSSDITANDMDVGRISTNYGDGLIDDVRIYNYALSADQVKNVYNGGYAAFYGPSEGSP